MRALTLTTLAAAISTWSPEPASACSPPQCRRGAFVPGDATTIPANAPGLLWRPSFGETGWATPTDVRMTRTSDPGTALPFAALATPDGDYVLIPDAPLVTGDSYMLADTTTCAGEPNARVTFSVGPAAPRPTSLGIVVTDERATRGDLEIATAVGSCSTTVDAATLDVELTLSAEAQPWAALLLFETRVDDQRWIVSSAIGQSIPPGSTWMGRGRDRLFRACTPNEDATQDGLSSGAHDVEMRAALPGLTPIASATVPVELGCDPEDTEGGDVDVDVDSPNAGCASSGKGSLLGGLLVLGVIARRRRTRELSPARW